MSSEPQRGEHPLCQLLLDGRVEEFNALRAQGEVCDLRGTDLSSLDLRGLQAQGLDLRDCYLRASDLRGVDLCQALLEGASINGSKISGAYFPMELSPEEITLSLLHGTRMRYRT